MQLQSIVSAVSITMQVFAVLARMVCLNRLMIEVFMAKKRRIDALRKAPIQLVCLKCRTV